MEHDFSAPWSRLVKVITYITSLLIVVICGFTACAGIVWALVVLAIFLTVLWAPRGYRITRSAVLVRRFIGNVEIPLTDITKVEIHDFAAVFRLSIRFGSGGYFGVFGRFYGGELRAFNAYVTNDGPLVVLRLKTGLPVVLSPDNPHEFARIICEYAGVPDLKGY